MEGHSTNAKHESGLLRLRKPLLCAVPRAMVNALVVALSDGFEGDAANAVPYDGRCGASVAIEGAVVATSGTISGVAYRGGEEREGASCF